NLTLNNANTYSGGTVVAGTLVAGNAGALGGGIVTFAGGTLAAAAKLTVGNDLSIPNTAAVLGGNASLTLSGKVNVLGTSTLALTNTAITTLSGTITGPGVLATAGTTGNLLLNP